MTTKQLTKFASPQALIKYLQEPGRGKTTGQLAEKGPGNRRCCLGHYCDLNGLEYKGDAATFEAFDPNDYDPSYDDPDPSLIQKLVGRVGKLRWKESKAFDALSEDAPLLPVDHWLFTQVDNGENFYGRKLTDALQSVLARLNDEHDGFDAVIARLKRFIKEEYKK